MHKNILLATLLLFPTFMLGASEAAFSTSDLPDSYYARWLAQVAPLIEADERQAFLDLTNDGQRESFIEGFWRARDDDPATPFNPWRERYEQQVQDAANRFVNLTDERAQMSFLHGAPRYVHGVNCPLLKPMSLFYFPSTARHERALTALFVAGYFEPRRYELRPGSRRHGDVVRDADLAGVSLAEMLDRAAEEQCFLGQEQLRGFLEAALTEGTDWRQARESSVFRRYDEQWLTAWQETFAGALAEDPHGMEPDASLEIVYPTRQGPRTVLQGHVRVATEVVAEWLSRAAADGDTRTLASSFLLSGQLELVEPPSQEELGDGAVFPRQVFRQRFHLTADDDAEGRLENTYQSMFFFRDALPGRYAMTLRVQAPGGATILRDYRILEVPAEADPSALAPSPGAVEIAPENLAILALRPSVQILPLPALQVGVRPVQVVTSGEGIAALQLTVDGRAAGRDEAPPWDFEVDFGAAPRPHLLRVQAIDSAGRVLAQDALRINAGAHRFAVRLLDPSPGQQARHVMRVRAAVELPTGAHFDRLQLFLEETPVATLYQPPYVHMVTLDPLRPATYVKAVAHLADGSSTSDLVVVNVPGGVEEIDVRQVELFANVFDRRQRPVRDLQGENFRVFEDGDEQTIQKVERVEDLPVHLALLIDSSSSMVEEMPLSIDSALRFFETVLTPEDQAAVVAFNHNTRLAVPFTRDLDWLADGVSTLDAYGGTAVWDSIVSTLHYFGGLAGKRAIVLLSDGDDQHSRFKFSAARDVAQRAGVSIYTISLNVGWEEPDNELPQRDGVTPGLSPGLSRSELNRRQHRRRLEQLAKETGGLFFKLSSIKALDRALGAIGDDVRTQYLITYPSSREGQGFREIEVKTTPRKLKVRTVGGYYP